MRKADVNMANHNPTFDNDTAQRLAENAARMLDIAIAPEWMPAVIQNLRANHGAAQLLLSFPLDDEAESAMVFRA